VTRGRIKINQPRSAGGIQPWSACLLQALRSGRWRIACTSIPLRGRSYSQLRAVLEGLTRVQQQALALAMDDRIGLAPAAEHSNDAGWMLPARVDAIARGLHVQDEAVLLQAAARDRFGRRHWLQPVVCKAWTRMRTAAAGDGIELELISAFRSFTHQSRIVERKLRQGQDWAQILRVSAAPGYSEHHTGCAVDLTTPGQTPLVEDFEHSPAFAWLAIHAGEFGFKLSYPRGNRWGFAYEPWHWCFRDHAVS
jgi:D-alanyl-D-alanine carboxypeptidase